MFRFNVNKATQAAGVLLEREPDSRTNYMRLLKLLYIADRETLAERGRPITGSPAYAMERGPVLGLVLDLIKSLDPDSEQWMKFIRTDHYDVVLEQKPGNLDLSRAEIRKLQEVSDRYRNDDEWALVKICHELPEFKKNDPLLENPPAKRKDIPLEDVLDAVGRLKDKDAILSQVNEAIAFADFFGDHLPTTMRR